MSYYSDPTANAAIGAIDKEIRAKKKYAKYLKALRKKGLISDEEIARARCRFPGLYRRFYMEIFTDKSENLRQENLPEVLFYPK